MTINTPKVLSLVKYGKLTERKVRYIVRHKGRGKSNREIAFEMRVSPSTVKRVWSYWLSHHEYLPIKDRGRPKVRDLSMNEKEIIKEAKQKYKLGARRLEKIIDIVKNYRTKQSPTVAILAIFQFHSHNLCLYFIIHLDAEISNLPSFTSNQ